MNAKCLFIGYLKKNFTQIKIQKLGNNWLNCQRSLKGSFLDHNQIIFIYISYIIHNLNYFDHFKGRSNERDPKSILVAYFR